MSTKTAEPVVSSKNTESRTCRINRSGEGEPLGVSIFLSPEELRKIGVDLQGESITYAVESGEIVFSEG
jgi:hypothetical protein